MQDVPPPPPPPPVASRAAVGPGCLLVPAVLGIPFSLLLIALTANPCGAFGDACEDRGEVTAGLIVSVGLLVCSVVAVVVALVWQDRRRRVDRTVR